MKKLPKLLLSTLIVGLVSSAAITSQASALYIDNDGATWYSVSELLAYKEEYEGELQEICGNNASCREELHYSRLDSGDQKLWALEQLTEQQITVTAVNPGAETLKVLFFDEDVILKHTGISEPLTLGEFYMGWFEYDVNRIYNYSSYTEDLFADTFPGAHLVYAQRDNDGDKIPANQEFEMSVNGSNLSQNTSGEIAYGAYADPYFNAAGRFIYTSCLSEPDYVEGIECKMMVSPEKGTKFFPPRETTEAAEPTDYGDIDNYSQDDLTGQDDVNLRDDEISEQPEALTAQSETDSGGTTPELALEKNTSSQVVEVMPKTPNTGTYSNPCAQKTVEFPWWLVVIIALGDAAILWLFWPKSRKNLKKTLDKKLKVR